MSKKIKPKFKAGSIVKSQLPRPNSPKAGTLYYIKDIENDKYVVCDYPSKKKPEKIPFKYIDSGCYLDGIYTYNYILYKEDQDGKDSRKNTTCDKESNHKGARQKAKPKTHRDVRKDDNDSADGSQSRTTSGSSKGRSSGSGKSRARSRRKKEEISLRGEK